MKSYLSYIGSILVLVGIYFVYHRFVVVFNNINWLIYFLCNNKYIFGYGVEAYP